MGLETTSHPEVITPQTPGSQAQDYMIMMVMMVIMKSMIIMMMIDFRLLKNY